MKLKMTNKILFSFILSLSFALGSASFADMTEELESGKLLTDGTIVGEKEALAYFKEFEPKVYKKLHEMDASRMRKTFADKFVWYQRVGNYRKQQKCEALQNIQTTLGLPKTDVEKCIDNILKPQKK